VFLLKKYVNLRVFFKKDTEKEKRKLPLGILISIYLDEVE